MAQEQTKRGGGGGEDDDLSGDGAGVQERREKLAADTDDLLDEIMPEGHDERDEDRPGVIHDLTHLRKRPDCEACQAKVKMSPARRKDPLLRERPSGWAHTLLADHLSASDMKVEKQDFKMCLVLLCAGTSVGDVIPVKSKSALHTVMALREFYAEDQFYFFYSDNAPELKSAASNDDAAPHQHA